MYRSSLVFNQRRNSTEELSCGHFIVILLFLCYGGVLPTSPRNLVSINMYTINAVKAVCTLQIGIKFYDR